MYQAGLALRCRHDRRDAALSAAATCWPARAYHQHRCVEPSATEAWHSKIDTCELLWTQQFTQEQTGNRTAAAVPASSGRSLRCCAAAPVVLAAVYDATTGFETGTPQSPFVLRQARSAAWWRCQCSRSSCNTIPNSPNSPVVPSSEYEMTNAGSQSGTVALPMFAPYACSKFGVEALSDCLRLELAGQVGGLPLHAIKDSVPVHHSGAPTERISRAPLVFSS